MYQCSDLFSFYEFCKVALLIHIEHDNRHVTLAAKCKCSLVHNFETILNSLVKAEFLILDYRDERGRSLYLQRNLVLARC